LSFDVDEENDDIDDLVEDGDDKTTVAKAAATSTRAIKRNHQETGAQIGFPPKTFSRVQTCSNMT
jgi:hypothetical protein